jgi:hypothetical protein
MSRATAAEQAAKRLVRALRLDVAGVRVGPDGTVTLLDARAAPVVVPTDDDREAKAEAALAEWEAAHDAA